MTIPAGTRLGSYEIVAPLGAGGMGQVYRARDTRLERDVALKLLTDGDGAPDQLLREARNASALNHPNICTLHEIGESSGRPFIVMELVDGDPLDRRIGTGGLPAADVVRIGQQLADGLAHAHARGVIHRDLKSANVVLTADGRAKILDFGIARRIPSADLAHATQSMETLTGATDLAGTLPYMAPETLEGRPADARSDLWALGVILVEASTGQRPFHGPTGLALASSILRDEPEIPASLPPALAGIARRCLAKRPADRFQSAAEAARALRDIASEPTTTRRWRLRRRGVVGTIAALLLLAALAAWTGMAGPFRGATDSTPIRSVAVLPLENLSGNEQQRYFADGMTEALISQLSALHELRVISRTSVMQFKGTTQSAVEIARALGVDGIVEGAILHDGEHVRITARLVDARSDRLVWRGEYEKPLSGAIALQREIAARIGREIHGELTAADSARLARRTDVTAGAFEAYLRGRFHWNLRTHSDLVRAQQLFEESIAQDPSFAPAHAGLADVFVLLGDYRDMLPAEAYRRARASVEAALRLDPELAEAHTTRAWLAFAVDRDWQAAEQSFARALQLNRGYATAHQWRGEFLIALGRFDEAFVSFRQARSLDPLALMPQAIHGWAAYIAGRYDEAIALCEEVLARDPAFRPARMYRAWSYMEQKRPAEAQREIEALLQTSASTAVPIATLGRIHARRGDRPAAHQAIAQLKALAYPPSFDIAKVHADLRDRAETLHWLQEAETEQNSAGLYVNVDRAFEWLRGDVAFDALRGRLHLTDAESRR